MIITQHFSSREFDSHDGIIYPVEWRTERLRPLCRVLETLRFECGGSAIRVLSGYRSPAHNAAVGGAVRSQHMEGRAADIIVAAHDPSLVHEMLYRLYVEKTIKIGGLGIYNTFVHVDTRTGDHLVQWAGKNVHDGET